MKYIIIAALVFCSCQSKEDQQKAQTEQINKDNRESMNALLPLMQERDRKIGELVKQGKQEEAAAVGREFIRKRDSVMRIKY